MLILDLVVVFLQSRFPLANTPILFGRYKLTLEAHYLVNIMLLLLLDGAKSTHQPPRESSTVCRTPRCGACATA